MGRGGQPLPPSCDAPRGSSLLRSGCRATFPHPPLLCSQGPRGQTAGGWGRRAGRRLHFTLLPAEGGRARARGRCRWLCARRRAQAVPTRGRMRVPALWVSRPDPRSAGRRETRVSGRGHCGSSWRQLAAGTHPRLPMAGLAVWAAEWAGTSPRSPEIPGRRLSFLRLHRLNPDHPGLLGTHGAPRRRPSCPGGMVTARRSPSHVHGNRPSSPVTREKRKRNKQMSENSHLKSQTSVITILTSLSFSVCGGVYRYICILFPK